MMTRSREVRSGAHKAVNEFGIMETVCVCVGGWVGVDEHDSRRWAVTPLTQALLV